MYASRVVRPSGLVGRGNRIRTCDLLYPIQVRYRAAPCPDAPEDITRGMRGWRVGYFGSARVLARATGSRGGQGAGGASPPSGASIGVSFESLRMIFPLSRRTASVIGSRQSAPTLDGLATGRLIYSKFVHPAVSHAIGLSDSGIGFRVRLPIIRQSASSRFPGQRCPKDSPRKGTRRARPPRRHPDTSAAHCRDREATLTCLLLRYD